MTVESGEVGQEQVEGGPVAETGVSGEAVEQGGLNPAWNDLLQIVPSQLHSQVTPHLSKWDQNFQSKLNEVHSQYAGYKPYLDNEIEPDRINYALQMLEAIDQRPMDVINALTEYAKQTGLIPEEPEQGQVDEPEIPSDFLQHPEFQKMQQMLNTMAQFLVQQNQESSDTQQDQELADEITQLKQTHGEFDEDWVLTKALAAANAGQNVNSLEPFVQQYVEHEKGILAKARQPGPRVMSPGGIAPDNQVNTKELDDKGRRGLVAQMLEAAAQNSQ